MNDDQDDVEDDGDEPPAPKVASARASPAKPTPATMNGETKVENGDAAEAQEESGPSDE